MLRRSPQQKLKVAICGTRGIPACYGGFETFAEELATRLVQSGYEVVVYGRSHVIQYKEPTYRGAKLVLLPAVRQKYLETPLHSLLSFLHSVFRERPDVAIVCNAANSPFLWVLRAGAIPAAVNVDGIERKRAKWSAIGKLWYRLGEISSVWFANEIVSDAEVIRAYYDEVYNAPSTVIPYGFRENREHDVRVRLSGGMLGLSAEDEALFRELSICPGEFFLYVSRFEPENHAHTVIAAYESLPEMVRQVFPLVMVGDAPYAKDYIARLRAAAGPQVRFAGYRFGRQYETLQLGCAAYVQATEVGGTHPALVEAMGYGSAIVANDTPENREVLGEAGLLYTRNEPASLASAWMRLAEERSLRVTFGRRARARAEERYSWDGVVSAYEQLLKRLLRMPQNEASASTAKRERAR